MSIDKPFSVIQTLCRIGLGNGEAAFRHQVERLIAALSESGQEAQAAALAKILQSTAKQKNMAPSRLIPSTTNRGLEQLSSKVHPPVDRETGAPLAEIMFPTEDNSVSAPILNDQLISAVESLIMEWSNLDRLAEMGVSPPRTCMIFGSPGTGKTHLAHYIASRLRFPLVLAKLDGLISSFLGTTARNLGALFQFCNRYRCLLLLDEFDAIAKLRDDPQELGEIKRVVNTLLQNIDNRANIGLSIAITNHEGLLDKAIWRRFEIRIALPMPDQRTREELFARYLPPLGDSRDWLRFLGWMSDGMSGSEIKTMTDAMKRQVGLETGALPSLFELTRRFALTHAGGENAAKQRLKLLFGNPQLLAHAAMSDDDLSLTQEELASIMGKDQATISRWISKATVGD
jgi:ATP-dependent 26S proteasome regulatory subunit